MKGQDPQPSACDYILGETLQQWLLGHGKKAGKSPAMIQHNNYWGTKSSKSAVCASETKLASQRLWGLQHLKAKPTNTLPIRSAPCVVGPNQNHVYTYIQLRPNERKYTARTAYYHLFIDFTASSVSNPKSPMCVLMGVAIVIKSRTYESHQFRTQTIQRLFCFMASSKRLFPSGWKCVITG